MARPPHSDEYTPEDLDGHDFAQSYENGEIFGPTAATRVPLAHSCSEINLGDGFNLDPELFDWPEGNAASDVVTRDQVLEAAKFTCAYCRVRCPGSRHLLELHHPGRDKSTHEARHLLVLCIDCHANMPDHGFLRGSRPPKWFDELEKMRAQQNLPSARVPKSP